MNIGPMKWIRKSLKKKQLIQWIEENLEEEKIKTIDIQTLGAYGEEVLTLILSSTEKIRLYLLEFFALKRKKNPVYEMYQKEPLKIVEIGEIIKNQEWYWKAEHGAQFACNEDVLKNENAICYVALITNAKESYQARYGAKVAQNKKILERKDGLQFVEAIVNAKRNFQAEYGSYVAQNEKILEREDGVQFVEAVANAKGEKQAIYGAMVARDETILKNENALQYVRLITSAEEDYQAQYGAWVAQNEKILEREDGDKFVEAITNAKGKEKALYGAKIAQNGEILARKDGIQFVETVTKEPRFLAGIEKLKAYLNEMEQEKNRDTHSDDEWNIDNKQQLEYLVARMEEWEINVEITLIERKESDIFKTYQKKINSK